MNRGLNKMLNDIVLKELPLSNKNRTVSHRVLVNFSKIISGRNNEIKQEAMHLPITFTDWIEEPFKKIKYFDLLLLTSINEGMGMVILEAANLNRPTISRDVGGVKEFIADDQSGFLIDGGPEMMALKILQLSREEMYKVGLGARNLLEKDFTDINMAEKYSLIYQSLFKDFIRSSGLYE